MSKHSDNIPVTTMSFFQPVLSKKRLDLQNWSQLSIPRQKKRLHDTKKLQTHNTAVHIRQMFRTSIDMRLTWFLEINNVINEP